eukprot:266355-Pyramimonas_sp.AAC.1
MVQYCAARCTSNDGGGGKGPPTPSPPPDAQPDLRTRLVRKRFAPPGPAARAGFAPASPAREGMKKPAARGRRPAATKKA